MPAGTQVASLFGVLSLDDKDFNRGVDGAENKMQGLAGTLGGIVGGIGKAAALGATAVVGATAAIGAGMFQLAKDAAPIEGVKKAFEGIAEASGKSADETLKALAASSKGMIKNTDLMMSYNTAAQLVSTEFANQLPEAMQYLTKVAAATGQDMGFMMDSLVKGVGRASPMILDNLGIQVNLTEATEEYAKANGKSADQLTKSEIQAAVMAKTLQQLKKNTAAMPDITDNASTKWGQFQTRLANFKDDVGVKLLPFFEQVIGFLMQLADQVLPIVVPVVDMLARGFTTFFDALSDGVDPIESVAMAIFSVFGQSSRPLVDFLKTIGDGFEAIVRGIRMFISDLQSIGLVDAILEVFGVKSGESWLEWVLVSFGMARETAHNAVTAIGNFLQGLIGFITGTVVPGLQLFSNWFTQDALPKVKSFLENEFRPALEKVFGWLSTVWTNTIQPELSKLYDWFVNSGFPAVRNFVVGTLKPDLETVFNWLANVWSAVIKPGLDGLYTWFTTGGLQEVINGVLGFIEHIDEVPGRIQKWIDQQGFLAQRLEDLLIAMGIGIAVFAVWNGLVFIAGVASTAAAAGVAAITGALTLMLSPLGLIIIGLTTAIALYHQLQTFQDQVKTAAQGAQGATAAAISNGLTLQQYKDKAFASSVAELGDAGARLFWANGGEALFERTYANAVSAQKRAGGGSVTAGNPYIVGEQGPELFTPGVSGNISTAQQTAGMMGGVRIENVNVYANTYEGGQAAAQGFRDKARSMGYSFG